MSRTGIEAKPPWKHIPQEIRQQVETSLGAPVLRAVRIWGGYAPTPTFRLTLANGRHAFFKGTYRDSNAVARQALQHEERVYRDADLEKVLGKWRPRWLATIREADWYILLLEDLGPKSVPPWTPKKTRTIARALAEFHQATRGMQAPAWLSRPDIVLPRVDWRKMAQESQEFQHIAVLAQDQAPQALTWLQQISPRFNELMHSPTLREGDLAILHGDLRSDNLRLQQDRIYLFDWPAITVGRPEWDIVAFAQSVTVEGGAAPEQVLNWYGERAPLDQEAVACALVWWFTFFADRAWQPEIPGLPRVRRFQRQQLGTMAFWATRQWALPYPTWAENLLK